jgi:excisionase family DNA binding protein
MNEIILIQKEVLFNYLDERFQEVLQEVRNCGKTTTIKEELITFKETLRLLKISRPTLFKRMKDGTIPFRRIGRRLLFSRNEIIEKIKKNQIISQ